MKRACRFTLITCRIYKIHEKQVKRRGIEAFLGPENANGACADPSVFGGDAPGGGYRVPEDISVIGEGDIKIFGFCSPPLTAITADYQEMVSRMVEFVDGAPMGNRKIFIPQHLVERKSVFNRLQIG